MPRYPMSAQCVESLSQRIDQLEMENQWLLDRLMEEQRLPKDAEEWRRRHARLGKALSVCLVLNLISLLVIVRNLFPG